MASTAGCIGVGVAAEASLALSIELDTVAVALAVVERGATVFREPPAACLRAGLEVMGAVMRLLTFGVGVVVHDHWPLARAQA